MTQAVKTYGIGEGWGRSKEQRAGTGRRQRNALTGEDVIEVIEIKVCSREDVARSKPFPWGRGT